MRIEKSEIFETTGQFERQFFENQAPLTIASMSQIVADTFSAEQIKLNASEQPSNGVGRFIWRLLKPNQLH